MPDSLPALCIFACAAFCLVGCGISPRDASFTKSPPRAVGAAPPNAGSRTVAPSLSPVCAALDASGIEPEIRAAIRARIEASPEAFLDVLARIERRRAADPDLFRRVDKEQRLPADYTPTDLRPLDGTGLAVSRAGHQLRAEALDALCVMSAAARAEGVVLVVGSTYRSFAYQKNVFERSVAAEGLAETERSVAPPGGSQHQLGTALDFAPIDDSFAATAASSWLAANASRFGFSLSFPRGLERLTGYKWESWHYRYLGSDAARLIDEYFEGVQARFLLFLDAYSTLSPTSKLP